MVPVQFLWLLLVLIAVGLPIVFALGIVPLIAFMISDQPAFLKVVAQRLYAGIDQFPLLAIPLFILAGEIMNVGGITQRLVGFANTLVGHLRGGLAHVNIVSSIFFAGLSGSAVADTSALGSMLIPAMEKQGYTRRFAAAVTAASSVIGPIIPPSIIMVVYAYVMQVSIGALFLGGLVPGILTGLGLMIVTAFLAEKRNYPQARQRATLPEVGRAGWQAGFPLLTPLIILGGILSGVFTPTEAAAAAVVYSLVISLFVIRTLKLRRLPDLLLRTAVSSSVILLVVGMANVFGWVVTLSGLPTALASGILGISENPYLVLFLINVFLLFVGMFLDAGPAILILGPILAPIAIKLGVDPTHFAILMCVNLTIGLATPPMGLILFVASAVSRERVEAIVRDMLPYYLVHLLIILLITYVPAISLTIPRLFGLAP
ncbi:tripartite ATP-independent transporter DctM subunit [Defluviimonas denitrificans]|jgi:tripartite ATP-independent transporter DctM subunit|uniref:TRAP transporter large permease protein n=1 Tax=Albidovulum denitrificans TaxID=404881 RepID=A0A2S8RWB9_9RHOB|nr:TRAP transporter large permease [Defluviimonas denitrificans]PQV52854.1 tripartite ATP-independent transporter DctM subunit [Defluviimonas denitrificans]